MTNPLAELETRVARLEDAAAASEQLAPINNFYTITAAGVVVPATADPRTVLDDTCATATLPAGATTSGAGALTFDQTRMCRILTGAVTYLGPAVTLSGAHVIELDVEMVGDFNVSGLQFGISDLTVVRYFNVNFQGDGNIVVYDNTTSKFSTGTGRHWQGQRFRLLFGVSDLIDSNDNAVNIAFSFQEGFVPGNANTGGGGGSTDIPVALWMVADKNFVTAPGYAAGDQIQLKLSNNGTGSTRLYRVRHYRGAL